MTIHTKSYPRAAVIGNPSDGYFGKTIAFVFSNFCAEVKLEANDTLQIVPQKRDGFTFTSLTALHQQVQDFGYYGGIRLIKASIKKFVDYCQANLLEIPNQSFRIGYQSSIPNRLGLAGSSAIITACLKAIFKFYQIEVSKPIFANLVLSVETEELGIAAGLQDRVAQAFETPIYMNFDKAIMDQQSFGLYQSIPINLLPAFYIAYRTTSAEGSEVVHNNLKERFNSGDDAVIAAMKQFASLTDQAMTYLNQKQSEKIGPLMDQNFDLRQSICTIAPANLDMIKLARSVGASAKFTGSGGAIIGTYKNEAMYQQLEKTFHAKNIQVLQPKIVSIDER